MSGEENIATLRTVIDALNGGDIDAVGRYVTDGFARHDLSGSFLAARSGPGEVTSFLHGIYRAIPDLAIEIEDLIASSDKLIARYRFTGTHKDELLGVAGTGRRLEFSGINIYRFEGPKFAEVWQLWDWASVLQQVGALSISR